MAYRLRILAWFGDGIGLMLSSAEAGVVFEVVLLVVPGGFDCVA